MYMLKQTCVIASDEKGHSGSSSRAVYSHDKYFKLLRTIKGLTGI